MACESGGTGPSGPGARIRKRGTWNAHGCALGGDQRKEGPLRHAEPGFTLRPGESLEFAANVTKLNSTIANLKIVTAERRNFYGKNSWHLQAFARTENPPTGWCLSWTTSSTRTAKLGNFASQPI